MRVLHVIPSIAPRYGGPSHAVLGMCRALREHAGIEAEIATTDADGPQGRMRLDGDNPHSYQDVPVWMFPRGWSESWKYCRELGAWLMKNAQRYDVLQAHAVFTYTTRAAARAAKIAEVPLVLRPCGMLAPYSLRRSRLHKLSYWHLVEKHNLAQAACLHATTPGEQQELQRLVPGKRVECVPLGLDDEATAAPISPGAFRRRYGIPPSRPLLLYLSRLHRKKGLVDVLLPALASLPSDVMLAVVGEEDPHDPGYAQLVRSRVAQLGLSARVVPTGPLYSTEKWSAYDDADVYVLPSAHENFGITVIEAMARGLPCIVSDEVQAADLVRRAGCGEVVQQQPAAVANAAQRLLAMSLERRRELGELGRQFAVAHLSWRGVARQLAAVYESIVRLDGDGPANSLLKKGTGSERRVGFPSVLVPPRGACPPFSTGC